jgi:hypothetical protein
LKKIQFDDYQATVKGKSTIRNGIFAADRNNLLQIGVEPCAPIPIYLIMNSLILNRLSTVETETIIKFLADSRRYLTR